MADTDPQAPAGDDPSPGVTAQQRARAALASPEPSGNAGPWLLISLGLFVLSGSDHKLLDLMLLVVVIGIHELGHAAAMKVFGYRDLRIFFVPFLGGAASGRKTGAPVWQRAIVLLAGPLPGIGIGVVLALVAAVTRDDRLATAATHFFVINAFNLLPFSPLDGGRLLELALLGRHRFIEAAFALVSGLLLAGIAVATTSVGLGFLAFLALATLGHRTKLRAAADEVRARHGTYPAEAERVDDERLVALDEAAARVAPTAPALRAQSTRALWESLTVPPPRLLVSLAIVATWGLSVVGVLLGGIIYATAASMPVDGADERPAANRHVVDALD